MVWRRIGTTLIVAGVVLMLCGLGAWPAQGAELARPPAQPSPRPTLVSTATSAGPTATAAPASGGHKSHGSSQGAATGRLTGTIIDLTSGAPVPGITVDLGGLQVTSDANGNYDHWLPPGSYQVALALAPDRGVPAQGPQIVEMQSGATVVLHLSFRSPPPPSATPAPATATPRRGHTAGAASREPKPTRLPVTAEQPSSAWLWLLIGVMLLGMGGALELKGTRIRAALPVGAQRFGVPRRQPAASRPAVRSAPADSTALLAALLAADARPARSASAAEARPATSDELLEALLRETPRAERPARRS